ncbi:MAG: hypothetical protein R3C09_28485 [Pirellulaceae bacterium]
MIAPVIEKEAEWTARKEQAEIESKRVLAKVFEDRQFVIAMYENLKEWRFRKDFHSYGFSIGGPYNRWLVSIQNKRGSTASWDIEPALRSLVFVGMTWMQNEGKETEVARDYRNDLEKIIESWR